jgi:hypothetical protein
MLVCASAMASAMKSKWCCSTVTTRHSLLDGG